MSTAAAVRAPRGHSSASEVNILRLACFWWPSRDSRAVFKSRQILTPSILQMKRVLPRKHTRKYTIEDRVQSCTSQTISLLISYYGRLNFYMNWQELYDILIFWYLFPDFPVLVMEKAKHLRLNGCHLWLFQHHTHFTSPLPVVTVLTCWCLIHSVRSNQPVNLAETFLHWKADNSGFKKVVIFSAQTSCDLHGEWSSCLHLYLHNFWKSISESQPSTFDKSTLTFLPRTLLSKLRA